ncbi:MAG TPA: class I SAM-dependent methyltransferase [Anaerolineales bacterium]
MNWHARYIQQAKWTRDLRTYLFQKARLDNASRVLEVGCGTGAILSELSTPLSLHGLDLDPVALAECRIHAPAAALTQGDALQLPYRKKTFDIVYCHYFLLWVRDPLQALLDMKRVAKSGAHLLAFAEPDYTARIDKPGELVQLGQWQTESLKRQGADPGLGTRLAELFFRAEIQIIETGTIQSAGREPSPDEWEMEWAVIESDLAGSVTREDIRKMKILDQKARARRERVLYVPAYFAWGRV